MFLFFYVVVLGARVYMILVSFWCHFGVIFFIMLLTF